MRPIAERSRDRTGSPDATVRVTVREAAEALGVTVEAVRGRMHRGKYGREKDEEGWVWVLLSPDQLPNGRAKVRERSSERSGSSSGERSRADGPTVYRRTDFDAEELRGELAYLKDVIATRDDELRRKDTIIMQMAQRLPELPSASRQEPRDGHEMDAESSEGVETMADSGDFQTSARRPWWRRLFGG